MIAYCSKHCCAQSQPRRATGDCFYFDLFLFVNTEKSQTCGFKLSWSEAQRYSSLMTPPSGWDDTDNNNTQPNVFFKASLFLSARPAVLFWMWICMKKIMSYSGRWVAKCTFKPLRFCSICLDFSFFLSFPRMTLLKGKKRHMPSLVGVVP